jgi:hypothetical protein
MDGKINIYFPVWLLNQFFYYNVCFSALIALIFSRYQFYIYLILIVCSHTPPNKRRAGAFHLPSHTPPFLATRIMATLDVPDSETVMPHKFFQQNAAYEILLPLLICSMMIKAKQIFAPLEPEI